MLRPYVKRYMSGKGAGAAAGALISAAKKIGSIYDTYSGRRAARVASSIQKAVKQGVYKKKPSKKTRIKKKKRARAFKKKVLKVLDSSKALGTYVKVLPTWQYHITGTNSENRQGVHEFYNLRPLEVLDAASVLFNGKTAATDYTVTTNNFTGDYDFDIASWDCSYTMTNTSQYPLEFIAYVVQPTQDTETSPKVRWQASIDDLAGASTMAPEQMHLTLKHGNQEFFRYYKINKTMHFTISPGGKKYLYSRKISNYQFKQEFMTYQGNIIGFKRYFSDCVMIIQIPRIEYNSTGNKIGVPTGSFGGWVMERVVTAKIVAPDIASNAQQVDKMKYYDAYSTTLGTTVFPSKPTVANIPVVQQ